MIYEIVPLPSVLGGWRSNEWKTDRTWNNTDIPSGREDAIYAVICFLIKSSASTVNADRPRRTFLGLDGAGENRPLITMARVALSFCY